MKAATDKCAGGFVERMMRVLKKEKANVDIKQAMCLSKHVGWMREEMLVCCGGYLNIERRSLRDTAKVRYGYTDCGWITYLRIGMFLSRTKVLLIERDIFF